MTIARLPARIGKHIHTRYRAHRLGIDFRRSSSFQTPGRMRIDGRYERLFLRNEHSTRVTFMEIFLGDTYGIERLAFPVRTVLDIGAHSGLFSLHTRLVYKSARIHAYEPNADLRPYLEHQARLGRFEYYMEAVGSTDGRASLTRRDDSMQTRSYMDEEGDVPQVAFSHAIQRIGGHVDILKMDCEGAEWDIFADRDAWKSVRYLTMEYHLVNGRTLGDVAASIASLDFRLLTTPVGRPYGVLWAVNRHAAVQPG
jgi:FkbM family methyltransferase